MNLCVIPARGGSKRIPRKNIKDFCGKPMIAWSIELALSSRLFDKVIVSTDDLEIAETSKRYGAEVPFIRPQEFSNDFIGTVPVIKHAIEALANRGLNYDNVCCIYATAPFIQVDDLRSGLEKLAQEDVLFSFSVTPYNFPIQRAIKLNQASRVQMFYPEHMSTRSQDLENSYHDAGQFYWGRSRAWVEERKIFDSHSFPIILPSYRVQDIDNLEDWERAEIIFKMLNRQEDV